MSNDLFSERELTTFKFQSYFNPKIFQRNYEHFWHNSVKRISSVNSVRDCKARKVIDCVLILNEIKGPLVLAQCHHSNSGNI